MIRSPRPAVLGVVGALCLAAPGAAHAATLQVSDSIMSYRAAPGETNLVGGDEAEELRLVSGEYRFTDRSSSPVAVGPGCRRASTRVYACSATGVRRIVVELGDGSDQLHTSAGLPIGLRLVGGPGRDFLDYGSRVRPVIVTLDGQPNDGGSRDDNIAADVEQFQGGGGADRLRGDASAEFLYGEDGRDVVRGGAGDDRITAFKFPEDEVGSDDDGDDLVYGEAGDDRIVAVGSSNAGVDAGGIFRGGSDRVSCGPGRDLAVMDDRDTGGGVECEVLGVVGAAGQVYRGSPGNDTIELPDILAAEFSRASGLAGNDTLRGADFQRDDLRGGDGGDRIDSRGSDSSDDDTVDCGPGTDIAYVDRYDDVRPGCERVER